MRYTYVAAWSIIGGVCLPADVGILELATSENRRFILTREPDELLETVERGAAYGNAILNVMFGQAHGDVTEVVSAAFDGIVAERNRKSGESTILIVEARGDIEVEIEERRSAERDEVVICFGALDKDAIRSIHRPSIEAMKLALALESESPTSLCELANGVYLTRDDGKTVYSFTLKADADLSVAHPLDDGARERIRDNFETLESEIALERIQRLYVDMNDASTDRLKSFLSGWAALEMLIVRAFKDYGDDLLVSSSEGRATPLRDRFLQRVTTVMKDKYRLADKFAAVAVLLVPSALEADLVADYEVFCSLKSTRDTIYHGGAFTEPDLPLNTLSALLRRYLQAYLELIESNRRRGT